MHFGKAVREKIFRERSSVDSLAAQLGCHRQNVYATIRNPSAQLENVAKYAAAFNMKPHELVKLAEKFDR